MKVHYYFANAPNEQIDYFKQTKNKILRGEKND